MPNPRIAALSHAFDEVRSGIDTLEARAAGERRDLTDEEQTQSDTLYARAEELRGELEPLVTRERNLAATAGVLATLGLADGDNGRTVNRATTSAPAPAVKWTVEDAGRYFADYFRALDVDNPGGRTDRLADFCQRWGSRLDDFYRATGDGGFTRTVADQLTTDNAGILPVPILGPLLSFHDGLRPCMSSFTERPMPAAGKTFTRPRITQHVGVGEQTTEKTELTSQKMTIAAETVTKRTFGGVLNVSQQNIDWTDPAIMGILLTDFADVYASVTEGEACDALEALITTNTATWDATSVATILGSLTAAVVAGYTSAKRLPDTLWLSLDSWATLAALVNTNDEPVFPGLALGGTLEVSMVDGTPIGVKPVVAPQLATGTMILGVRALIESFEQRKGVLSAPNVALFGVDVAYAGYVAFYGRAEGFIGLTA